MAKAYQKLVGFVLVMLLAVGSVSNTAAGILSCLPKSCCCTTNTPNMKTDHKAPMAMPHNCTPKEPAPCCRVEPFQTKTEVAILSPPPPITQRMPLTQAIAGEAVETPQQLRLNALISILEKVPLKIPQVPIYLQTLSILC